MPFPGVFRSFVVTGLLVLVVISRPTASQDPALSVRITSPLGRTGIAGTVRIVAQVQHPPNIVPG